MLISMLSQTHINQSRKVCYELIKKLKKKLISKHCDKHDSSCLLQINVLWFLFALWLVTYRLSTCLNWAEWDFMHTIWCFSSNEKIQLSTQERSTIATSFVRIFWEYVFLSLFDYHCQFDRLDSCIVNKSKKTRKIEIILSFLQAHQTF